MGGFQSIPIRSFLPLGLFIFALGLLGSSEASAQAQPTSFQSYKFIHFPLFALGGFLDDANDVCVLSAIPDSQDLSDFPKSFEVSCPSGDTIRGTFSVTLPAQLPPVVSLGGDNNDRGTLESTVQVQASIQFDWTGSHAGPGDMSMLMTAGSRQSISQSAQNPCEVLATRRVARGSGTVSISQDYSCGIDTVGVANPASLETSAVSMPVYFLGFFRGDIVPEGEAEGLDKDFGIVALATYGAATAKVKPSVVFPAPDSHSGWELKLTGVVASDIDKILIDTLPDSTIASRSGDIVEFTQPVPESVAPGRYPVKVRKMNGQEMALGVDLYVGGIEIIDPYPDLLTEDGASPPAVHVTRNAARITGALSAGRIRKAISADGVNEVILRIPSDKPLVLSLAGNASSDAGLLRAIDGSQEGQTLDAGGGLAPIPDPEHGMAVYAVYRPPADLPEKSNVGTYDYAKGPGNFDDPDSADPGLFSIDLSIRHFGADLDDDIDNTEAVREHRALTLVRPPLILIHGVWSGPDIWEESGFEVEIEKLAGPRAINKANYRANNAASFDPRQETVVGVEALKAEIFLATKSYRRLGISVAQVDVIAHSMGGLMTRVFSQRPAEYFDKENYHKGWVHKLITLDTPHSGTYLGVFAMNNKDSLLIQYPSVERDVFRDGDYRISRDRLVPQRVTLSSLLETAEMPINKGAAESFQPCSPANMALEASTIPTHAVSGIRPDRFNELSFLGELAGAEVFGLTNVFWIVSFVAGEGTRSGITMDQLYGGREHDTIVEAISMRGGFPFAPVGGDALSQPAHDQPNVIHAVFPGVSDHKDTITGDPATFQAVGRIYRTPYTKGNTYGPLKAPRDYRTSDTYSNAATGPCDPNPFGRSAPLLPEGGPQLLQTIDESAPYLRIAEPAVDSVFAPGQTVTIRAEGVNGLVPTNTFFYGVPYSPNPVTHGGLEARLELGEAVGRHRIGVLAHGPDGQSYSALTEIIVEPNQPVTGLSVTPEEIEFTDQVARTALSVRGLLEDGSTISLNRLPGIAFTSADSAVVRVSAQGLAVAAGPGQTEIEVAYDGLEVSVPVTVNATNVPPRFTVIPAFSVNVGEPLTVPVEAFSAFGNAIDLQAASLPSFVTFTPNGSRGELRIAPTAADIGGHRILVSAVDAGPPPLSSELAVVFDVVESGASGPDPEPPGADGPAPMINAGGVVDAAQFQAILAPGGLGSIFGADLADEIAAATATPLPTELAGARVEVNGVRAPLVFVSPGQINFQMPFEVMGASSATIRVVRNGVQGPSIQAAVAEFAPQVFASGATGEPIVIHEDGSLVDASAPAQDQEILIVFFTGLGGLDNPPASGVASPSSPLAASTVPAEVSIGGQDAEVFFAGLTPSFVGLGQLNIRANLPTGALLTPEGAPQAATLPLVVRFGAAQSRPVDLPVEGVPGGSGSPAVEVFPASIDFGAAEIGETVEDAVVIFNNGDADLRVISLSIDSGAFQTSQSTPFTVPAQDGAVVDVAFRPTGEGGQAGTLRIATNDPAQPLVRVSLAGEGLSASTGAFLVFQPNPLDFGEVALGQSATLQLTLRNEGDEVAVVTAVNFHDPAQFAVSGSGTPPFELAPGAERVYQITFSPQSPGLHNTTAEVSTSDSVIRAVIRGAGVAPAVNDQLTVASTLFFGAVPVGRVREQSIAARNPGSTPVEVTSLASSDPQFRVAAPAAPFTIPPEGEVLLRVHFEPASQGAHAGQFSFATAGGASAQTAVSGNGSAGSAILLSDSLERADVGTCELGRMDHALGGSGIYSYAWVASGATLEAGGLVNKGRDYGGVQFAAETSSCPGKGTDIGQDLNIRATVFVPREGDRTTQAGPFFRTELADAGQPLHQGGRAGFWVQLDSSGEVRVMRLSDFQPEAVSPPPASFDATVPHVIETSVNFMTLTVAVDGRLRIFSQGPRDDKETVELRQTGGANEGGAGVAFGSTDGFGAVRGTRMEDVLVREAETLLGTPAVR